MSSRSAGIALALLLASAAGVSAGPDRVVINPKSQYPEGPLVDGQSIYYAEMGADRVMRWDGEHSTPIWNRAGCGPTSVARGTGGTLIILCDEGQVIVRITPEGKTVDVIDKDANGQSFVAPNASINDAKGGIYWSASGLFSPVVPAEGAVMYLAPDGTLHRLAEGIHYSNGVALTPDGKTLYVSEHLSRRILAYDVADDASLSNPRVFLRLDDVVGKDPRREWDVGPDGLAVDHAGNLYMAEYGGGRVIIVDKATKLVATIPFPQQYVTAPVLIDGEKRLFVTAPASLMNPQAYGAVYTVPNPVYGK